MVELMLQYADLYDFDILYQVEIIGIDQESVYSIITESTSEENSLTSADTKEEDKYLSSSDIELNMVVIQDEGTSSPHSKFENQTLNWKTSKWTLKHWHFREDPPPPNIPIHFYIGISRDIHLCEECGYSTTNGGKMKMSSSLMRSITFIFIRLVSLLFSKKIEENMLWILSLMV